MSATGGAAIPATTDAPRRRRPLAQACLALALLALVTRLPALAHPQPIDDEAIYSVVADEMVAGALPYRDAVERKPPLLFDVYAAVFAAAGKGNWLALHAVATAWVLATMLALLAIGSRVHSTSAGVAAAVFYGVFQAWATWRNLAFNGEVLMNLPIAWAWAIALGRGWTRGRLELFVVGVLSAAAFLLKQPGAIAAVPILLYLWLPAYRRTRHISLAQSMWQSVLLAAGVVSTIAVVAAWLWRRGILAEAIYWTIGDHDVPHVFWWRAVVFTVAFAAACLPVVLLAILAMTRSELWAGHAAEKTALAWLTAASAVGTAAGARFYPHYYIQLLLPATVLAGVAFAGLRSGMLARPRWVPSVRVLSWWVGLCAAGFSIAHWYGLAGRREPSAAGLFVREHSQPEDRLFVWGEAPQIYLDAQRRPASRYVATFPLTGYIFGGPIPGLDTRNRILPGSWDRLQQDFAAHPPMFIVDHEAGADALYPAAEFPALGGLLTREFEVAARTPDGVVYRRRLTASAPVNSGP